MRTTKECDCIVDYYGVDKREGQILIFMELMEVSLEKFYKQAAVPMPEAELRQVAYSILTGLAYLYQEHNILHRDVKPTNMLLGSDGSVKLCDFGLSKAMEHSLVASYTGSPPSPLCAHPRVTRRAAGCDQYLAPERIDSKTSSQAYNDRSDVWAYGISLVEIADRRYPYAARSDGPPQARTFQIFAAIVNSPAPPLHERYSPDLRQFVALCTAKAVDKRPRLAKPRGDIVPLVDTPFYAELKAAPAVNVLAWYRGAIAQ